MRSPRLAHLRWNRPRKQGPRPRASRGRPAHRPPPWSRRSPRPGGRTGGRAGRRHPRARARRRAPSWPTCRS
eukprot:12224063-Alexandrium_andersonii.AAC.1